MSIESISSIASIPEGTLLASVVSFETCESKDKDGSKQKYTVDSFIYFKKYLRIDLNQHDLEFF